jgi:capsid protein
MKQILDHKGNPVHFGYQGASINSKSIDYFTNFSSIHQREEKVLSEGERAKLLSNLRNSFRNNIITNAIVETLQTNVGKCKVQSKTGEKDFDSAREKLFKRWSNEIEITGHNLGNVLKLVIQELALAGDCLIVLLKNGKIQLVPSERICSSTNPEDRKSDEVSGCRINKYGAITHFRVCGYDANGNVDKQKGNYVTARDGIFIKNQTRIGSVRGIPMLAPAMNALQAIEEIHQSYTTKIKVNSLFACAITSNSPYDDRWSMNGHDGSNRSSFTTLESGSLLMLEEGEDIKEIDASKGTNEIEKFLLYLITFVASPIVGSIESLVGYSNATFASSRVTKTQANFKFKQYREMLEEQLLKRLFSWKTRKMQKFGDLPDDIDFNEYEDALSFNWTYLPVLDSEKQANVDAKMIENNLISYTDLFAEKGKDFEEEVQQIAKDKLLLQQLMTNGKTESDGGTSMKEMVDAYGVAVRSGSITPQFKDEQHIREMLNLPTTEQPVQDAWEQDGGARRPITLQSQEAFESTQEEIQEEMIEEE